MAVTKTSKTKTTAQPTSESFIALLESHIKDPYEWGGTSLTLGADCSGFIYAALIELGVKNPPRTAAEQAQWLKNAGSFQSIGSVGSLQNAVNESVINPGDLVFFHIPVSAGGDGSPGINHVGIYVGNGKILQETGPNGTPASYATFSQVNKYVVGFGDVPALNYNTPPADLSALKGPNAAPQNNTDWAIAILNSIGVLPTQNSISALQAQIQLEGVNPAYNNPLGIKVNGQVVKFANWQDGVAATAKAMKANDANLIGALQQVDEYPTSLAQAGNIYANALEHANWEGFTRAPNISYGKEFLKVFEGGITIKPSGPYQNYLNSNAGQAVPESDGLGNPLSGIEGAIEDLAKVFSFFTSKKFWLIVAGSILVIIGLVLLFKNQIKSVANTASKAAVVAA